MALLALYCGLRAGEIFNLKSQDLDFENRLITISDPKNKESRKAFMNNAVKEMLLARVTGKPDELIFKARNHHGGLRLFLRRSAKQLTASDSIKAFPTPSRLLHSICYAIPLLPGLLCKVNLSLLSKNF